MKCVVRVPATTANLGPGFDSFGCALGIYNTYTFETIPSGLEITGCPKKYRNEKNLTVRAYRMTLEAAGVPFEGLRMDMEANIPLSRGLGSSAAMIVAGVVAANAVAGYPFDDRKMLELAMRLEGHPDNLAPAFYGGLTASMVEEGLPDTVRFEMAKDLRFVVCVPEFELSTSVARKASTISPTAPCFSRLWKRAISRSSPARCGIGFISPIGNPSLRNTISSVPPLWRRERWAFASAERVPPFWRLPIT